MKNFLNFNKTNKEFLKPQIQKQEAIFLNV